LVKPAALSGHRSIPSAKPVQVRRHSNPAVAGTPQIAVCWGSMTGGSQPNLYIVAGPNGAGKSTFARLFLPDYADCREFVNADLIAAGLSPFNPEGHANSRRGDGK
jgi:hypothetical protein